MPDVAGDLVQEVLPGGSLISLTVGLTQPGRPCTMEIPVEPGRLEGPENLGMGIDRAGDLAIAGFPDLAPVVLELGAQALAGILEGDSMLWGSLGAQVSQGGAGAVEAREVGSGSGG